jgi:hypothetical protein
MYLRQPVLPALLRRFDRDGLPLGLFLCSGIRVEVNHASRGKKRENFCCANLDCFLHDQVHVLSLRDGLSKAEPSAQLWRQSFLQDAQLDCITTERADLGRRFAPVAIEHDESIARCKPEDIAGMMRFRSGKTSF